MGLSKTTVAVIYIGLIIGIPVVCWVIAVKLTRSSSSLATSRLKTLFSGRIRAASLGGRMWRQRHHGVH